MSRGPAEEQLNSYKKTLKVCTCNHPQFIFSVRKEIFFLIKFIESNDYYVVYQFFVVF